MAPFRIGPHDQNGWPAGVAWARRANVVKSVGNPAAIMAAPDLATRLYRWPFSPAEQSDMIRRGDYVTYGLQLLAGLAGYNHPRLWLEGPNEPGAITAELVAFHRGLKTWLEQRGYQLTGPCSATGSYTAEDVEKLRSIGLTLWTFHAYWTKRYGFTIWNAWRWRMFWRPGDPAVVVGECGFDQTGDGPNATLEPPPGRDGYGYRAQGVSDDGMVASLVAYADSLTEPYEVGAVAYTTSPNDEWKRKGFDLDPLAPRLAALSEPTPQEPPMATIKGIDVSNNQGAVDLGLVKAAGYAFVAMKAAGDEGPGDAFLDPFFPENWHAARGQELVRIAYHYAKPSRVSPAASVTTLQRAVQAVGGLAAGDLVALDMEDPDVPDGVSLHRWTAEWLALAEGVFGTAPLKYSAHFYTSTHDLEHADLERWPTWWASWQATPPAPEVGWRPLTIWQNSASGRVPGVQGDCDTDVYFGTVAELLALGLPAPAGVSWEAPVFAPIYRGASAVGGMPDKTAADEADAVEIIKLMDKLKSRHSA